MHKYLWSYIPHFIHSPFYVYAYAFGDCLVNSLYSVYEKDRSGFVTKYTDLLASGGSKHHKELLQPFDLDQMVEVILCDALSHLTLIGLYILLQNHCDLFHKLNRESLLDNHRMRMHTHKMDYE